jgi:transmembrane sensor
MNNRSSLPDHDLKSRAIEEQAAEWFGRYELGLTPDEERQFIRWLEADERHGAAVREMDETWEFLDGLKEIKRVSAAPAGHPAMRSPATTRRAWQLIFASAAAVAAIFAAVQHLGPSTPIVQQAVTAAGGMKKIELPDGSTVYLNASSGIDVRYTKGARHVNLLRGEAHFSVAKDVARPFVVTAGEVAVKAVGTAFNVRRESSSVEVFVTEGRVSLNDVTKGESLLLHSSIPTSAQPGAQSRRSAAPAEPGLLLAGQRALVPLVAAAASSRVVIAQIAPAEIQQALAWQERQLEFDLTPLWQVVAEFNRYNSHQLVVDDAELRQQLFGGSFRADNYSVFVQLLEQRFGVVAERAGETTILRRAK